MTIRFAKLTTPEDVDRDIARILARKRKRGLTKGEQSTLEVCYEWLERHYSKERE